MAKRSRNGSAGVKANRVQKRAAEPDLSDKELASSSADENQLDQRNAEPSDGDSEASEASEPESEPDSGEDPPEAQPENKGASNVFGPQRKKLKGEDLRVARETSELFKSNIFKLQVDELLKELTIEEKYIASANKALHALKDDLLALAPGSEVSLKEAQLSLPNKIPFPDQGQSALSNLRLQFLPPQEVNVVGSYSLQTVAKQPEGAGIDFFVEMPSELFEKKDYLNYRYFYKRAFYVAHIAHAIAKMTALKLKTQYQYFDDDVLRPVLRLDFSDNRLAKSLHIIVHFGVSPDLFPKHKLEGDRNSVRSVDGPTPIYNSAVLADTSYLYFLRFLHATSGQCRSFVDACKLGKLWLRKRGFSSSPRFGGFGAFEFAVTMAALLNGGHGSGKRVLLTGYSSYQLFKGTILYIAANGFDLSFSKFTTIVEKSVAPTLVAADVGLNILARTPVSAVGLLRHDAAVTAEMLSDYTEDRFESIFIQDLRQPQLRFDAHFRVRLPKLLSYNAAYWPNYKDFVAGEVGTLLKKAWGDRSICFSLIDQDSDIYEETTWALSSTPPVNRSTEFAVTVGVILDPSQSERRLTFGPGADEPEKVSAFKNFWGSKSNLRRFQDGTIKEAVVWELGALPVVVEIAKFVVEKHLRGTISVPPLVDTILYTGLERTSSVISVAPYQVKLNAFQQTCQTLQDVDNLPLRIAGIYGTSSSLRYTSVEEPAPYDLKGDDAVGKAIIQLESSGKWPSETKAIEKTKTAFLIKMAEEVRKKAPQYTATVGVEPSLVAGDVETGFLVLQSPTGFSFQFRIVTHRDEHIFKRALMENHKEAAYLALRRQGTAAADHNRLISGMALRYPYYSPTARVLKVWFKRQLLGNHLTEQAIELLALKPFIDSSPYFPPASVSTAFYRIMKFLATWNWKEEPLIYDVSRTTIADGDNAITSVQGCHMDPVVYQAILASYQKHRQQDPALTLSPYYIGTKVDPSGILWTQALPRSRVGILIASRVTALARIVAKSAGSANINSFFTPALKDFDLQFRLKNPSASTKSKYKNFSNGSADPVKYLQDIGSEFFSDIAEAYKSSLVLFYGGAIGGKSEPEQVITGLWNRDVLAPQKYKVNIPYNVCPTGEGDNVVLNKEGILNEIIRLGGGMLTLERS